MKKTPNLYLNKPDREDRVKVSDLNQNADNLDIEITELHAIVNKKAPITSPQFAGIPLAPKPGDGDIIEQIATVSSITDALEVENLDMVTGNNIIDVYNIVPDIDDENDEGIKFVAYDDLLN